MEDMHIHLRNAIFDQKLFNAYIKKCLDKNLNKVVFLDHGNRISKKHKPVLYTKEVIDEFNKKIFDFKNTEFSSQLEIIRGIEIDYSDDLKFREETIKILDYGKFEWVVGAIHSIKFDNYEDYLYSIIDMLHNYNIDVIAHMKLNDKYYMYENLFIRILNICHEKNIFIEINTSERAIWTDEQLYYMLYMMKKFDVNYVFSSDAHKVEEIGYKIEEIMEKVSQWKKIK